MLGDELKLRVRVDQLKIRKYRSKRFAAARLLLDNFFKLKIVNEVALLDQRQKRVVNRVGHMDLSGLKRSRWAFPGRLGLAQRLGHFVLLQLRLDRHRVLRFGDHFLLRD